MKIGQYYQRQRCRQWHVELEQLWQAFASRGFVSDSWAFLLYVSKKEKGALIIPCTKYWMRQFNDSGFVRTQMNEKERSVLVVGFSSHFTAKICSLHFKMLSTSGGEDP